MDGQRHFDLVRFKLDENLPVDLVGDFRGLGHDAGTVADEGLSGAPDPTVLNAAIDADRILMDLTGRLTVVGPTRLRRTNTTGQPACIRNLPRRGAIMHSMPFLLSLLLLSAISLAAADPPTAEIGNGKIRARLYLPDAANGFYRGTRFDWSGVIHYLEAEGHTFYGPWFTKRNPAIRDFVYEGDDIIAGPCSSTTGPADEFRPVGYDAAKPGGTFIKIGVGALRKPDAAAYDGYRLYEVANPGKWTIRRRSDSIDRLAWRSTTTDRRQAPV